MFVNRRERGPDRWLPAKMTCFGLAAVAFFIGVRLDLGWVVWVSVGLLVAGFLLRFAPQEDGEPPHRRGTGP